MSISKYTFLVGALASILTAYPAAADDVAASVAARLRDSGRLEDYRVNVKANEGTVFLEGEVSDARQIAAAVSLAENTEGVERVVNRLSLKTAKKRSGIGLTLPPSMRTFIGLEPEDASLAGGKAAPQFVAAGAGDMQVTATPATTRADQAPATPSTPSPSRAAFVPPSEVVPAEAAATSTAPAEAQPSEQRPVKTAALEGAGPGPAAQRVSATAQPTQAPRGPAAAPTAARSNTPRPLAKTNAAAMAGPAQKAPGQVRQASPKKSQTLASWVKQVAGVMGGENVVPGSERVIGDYGPGEYMPGSSGGSGGYADGGYVDGGMADGGYVGGGYSDGGYVDGGTVSGGSVNGGYAGGYAGQPMVGGPGYGGGGMLGRPMPMGSAGVGMPPVPMRGDGPNMPNYAWPSYASYPNYAALQYPGQYSPTAWPYIGPFYPYPQVPLGWRRVSLEWDDGWWFLDFDDRPQHH